MQYDKDTFNIFNRYIKIDFSPTEKSLEQL